MYIVQSTVSLDETTTHGTKQCYEAINGTKPTGEERCLICSWKLFGRKTWRSGHTNAKTNPQEAGILFFEWPWNCPAGQSKSAPKDWPRAREDGSKLVLNNNLVGPWGLGIATWEGEEVPSSETTRSVRNGNSGVRAKKESHPTHIQTLVLVSL